MNKRSQWIMLMFFSLCMLLSACASDEPKASKNNINNNDNASNDLDALKEAVKNREENNASEDIIENPFDDNHIVASIEDYEYENWKDSDIEKYEFDEDLTGIAVFDDHIYTRMYDKTFRSYTKDLELRWKEKQPQVQDSDLLVTDDYVFENSNRAGTIKALDKKTGDVAYTLQFDDMYQMSNLFIIDDYGYIFMMIEGDEEKEIPNEMFFVKFDANNGEILYEKEVLDKVENHNSAKYAYNDDIIVSVNIDLHLTAYSLDSGEILWEEDHRATDVAGSMLLVEDDIIYTYDISSDLTARDIETGEIIDQYDLPGVVNYREFLQMVDGDDFYNYSRVTDGDYDNEYFYSYDMSSKSIKWAIDLSGEYAFFAHKEDDKIYLFTSLVENEDEEPSKMIVLDAETGEMRQAVEFDQRLSKLRGSLSIKLKRHADETGISLIKEEALYRIPFNKK